MMQLQSTSSKLLSDMLQKVGHGLPNVLTAIAIIIIGYIVAKIVAKVLKRLLKKSGVDKIGAKLNGIEFVEKSNINIEISSLISKAIHYFIMLFALVAGTDVLNMPAISNMVANFMEFLPNLLVAIVLIVIGLLAADLIRKAVHSTCTSLGIPTAKLIATAMFYFVFITVAVMALTQAGIETAFLSQNLSIIIAGAVLAFAIGYGLASKDSAANLLAGSYARDRVMIGDHIAVDGCKGKVVGLDRSTLTIDTGDSKIVLPLQKLLNSKLEIFK